jgi:hypothetical protein
MLTDQYSLGIIATELLGGSSGSLIPGVVHPCDLESKRELFAKLESAEGRWAKRSAQFTGVVSRMLRTYPEERWSSMREVRNILCDIDPIESSDEGHRMMAKLTRRHYEIFADTLVKTIGEFGQDDPDELNAWRCALEPAIAFIWKCQEEARAHDVDV